MAEQEKPAPPAPFVRYERWRYETKDVATVTPENVGQIASLVCAVVDYSDGEPVLVIKTTSGADWRVRCGSKVSLLGDRLVNQNGFDIDGGWSPTPDPIARAATSTTTGARDDE